MSAPGRQHGSGEISHGRRVPRAIPGSPPPALPLYLVRSRVQTPRAKSSARTVAALPLPRAGCPTVGKRRANQLRLQRILLDRSRVSASQPSCRPSGTSRRCHAFGRTDTHRGPTGRVHRPRKICRVTPPVNSRSPTSPPKKERVGSSHFRMGLDLLDFFKKTHIPVYTWR
jgi:hypothetical protein